MIRVAGRPAKPIQLHLQNGNKRHLTKAEIEARERQESSLRSGQKKYKASPQVKADKAAYAMFKKLQRLYREIEYVEGLDENVINRYCLLHSEVSSLRDMRQQLEERMTQLEDEEDHAGQLSLTSTILDIDQRQLKKMEMLLKLEDRLFLNPTARIKNVPRQQEQPTAKTPFERVFGNV